MKNMLKKINKRSLLLLALFGSAAPLLPAAAAGDASVELEREKHFVCEVCGRGFVRGDHLEAHRRIHSGEKPYTCEECGRGFTQVANLKPHMRTHTGERPFKCEWPGCNYAAQKKDAFNRHRYTHTGQKPFKCTEPGCEHATTQKGHLTIHMRRHTAEKPFKIRASKKISENRKVFADAEAVNALLALSRAAQRPRSDGNNSEE